MNGFNKILVVSQSTQECRKAVDYGIRLAEKFGSQLYVMQTYYNIFGLKGWNLPIPKKLVEDGYQQMLEETKGEIERLVQKAKHQDINIQLLLREGKFPDEVFKFVEEENVDLLVLASHPEWRLEHFLFGRDNEEILRKLPCSVTFVKDVEERHR